MMLQRLRRPATTLSARFMSSDARPMTRFIQYPFDKTKMAEVRAWTNEIDLPEKLRAAPGVKNVEFSFCPGEGWLAARYIFNDLDDMVAFLSDSAAMTDAKKVLATAPHYDSSRQPHEFKGFFLEEV